MQHNNDQNHEVPRSNEQDRTEQLLRAAKVIRQRRFERDTERIANATERITRELEARR